MWFMWRAMRGLCWEFAFSLWGFMVCWVLREKEFSRAGNLKGTPIPFRCAQGVCLSGFLRSSDRLRDRTVAELLRNWLVEFFCQIWRGVIHGCDYGPQCVCLWIVARARGSYRALATSSTFITCGRAWLVSVAIWFFTSWSFSLPSTVSSFNPYHASNVYLNHSNQVHCSRT